MKGLQASQVDTPGQCFCSLGTMSELPEGVLTRDQIPRGLGKRFLWLK